MKLHRVRGDYSIVDVIAGRHKVHPSVVKKKMSRMVEVWEKFAYCRILATLFTGKLHLLGEYQRNSALENKRCYLS